MPATSANAANPSAGTSASPTRSATAKDEATNDAVARFLADKGLLGSVALQVRDKAADLASDLVISAMDFLGVRYKSGGQSRDGGFDCSGFTRHVFERSIGMILPRRASEQANMPGLMQVSENELKPGDLVFFNTLRHTFSHVGIYVGDNKFIHSPRAGGQVRIEDMGQSYWQKRFDGARRVPRLSKQQAELAQH
ncbi:MAG: NlpC/P60 family protein [Rubrivivax sp.]|nr:MAG: NlpC/P60 family protein [Rubrivivax sp.]